ncbi:MAG: hypothetical protein WA964_12375 [Ilumatobacter sp.]|uniref:hypothetical protein n=1 Tax=Ilumatobacter sp. TaxID=1967498 RepID=UPI003C777F6E
MPAVEAAPTPIDRSSNATLLAQSVRVVVDHLMQSVQHLRHLHHVLDNDPTDVDARRILGTEFESAGNALAVAQSFEHSITQLEEGPVTVSALLNDEILAANVSNWIRTVDDAHRLVIADLTAIDAIASSFPDIDSPSASTRQVAAELIASLARNAIDRLDIAHPPLATP